MLYKFVKGTPEAMLDVFDKIVVEGSMKFSSVRSFNDPFEFKFVTVAPAREVYDAWHRTYAPDRSAEELERGWAVFSGPAADWNTNWVPRMNVLQRCYVSCLARRWDSHLMWAHYAQDHQGYAIVYRPEIAAAIEAHPDCEASGDVTYRTDVPELRWFQGGMADMIGPVLFTKSEEWSYEHEFRLILSGEPQRQALYVITDPGLVAGVILGTRASPALIERALAEQKRRPDFRVQQVTSPSGSYALDAYDMASGVRQMGHIL